MIGIEKTLEVFEDLGGLAVSAVKIAKSHGSFGVILGQIYEIAKSASELVKDVPGALPELMDIDGAESAKIGAASYALVKKIVEAVKA